MIGKGAWFQRRKYGGWGLFPKTWQGWAYIMVVAGLFTLIQYLPLGGQQNNIISTIVLTVLLIADIVDIMLHLKMDEREKNHEAKAERNALWIMLIILIIGTGWQAVTSALENKIQIDPVIIVAIAGAVVTKAISNIYLEHTN